MDDNYAREWADHTRSLAIDRGQVGDIEWLVVPQAPLPSLNGYLVLPEGHPWLNGEESRSYFTSPTIVDFVRQRWVGCCGLNGNGRWDIADLRRHVDPFPDDWMAVLEAFGHAGLEYPIRFGDGLDVIWTVESWTASVVQWAGAANDALSPDEEKE